MKCAGDRNLSRLHAIFGQKKKPVRQAQQGHNDVICWFARRNYLEERSTIIPTYGLPSIRIKPHFICAKSNQSLCYVQWAIGHRMLPNIWHWRMPTATLSESSIPDAGWNTKILQTENNSDETGMLRLHASIAITIFDASRSANSNDITRAPRSQFMTKAKFIKQ